MRVLLLAAGKGERMRPLTDETAKPLLEVGGKALIEHHLERLAVAGITEVIVNLSWHGDRIRERVQDGSGFGLSVSYSDEGPEPLETAGAIIEIRNRLGAIPFAVVNADIWTDYPFERLQLPTGMLAHLVLVRNPAHNPAGDFVLEDGAVRNPSQAQDKALTFAGIGVYSPELFRDFEPGKRALAPILRAACERGLVSGERYDGDWQDIGTPERLEALRLRFT